MTRTGCVALLLLAAVCYAAVIALADLAVQDPSNEAVQLGLGAAVFLPWVVGGILVIRAISRRRSRTKA